MKTILIVEAVASHREPLMQWLKDDYTVVTATDAAAGMALAEQTEPDLIFMALPGSAGAEVIRCLKAQARPRDVPIIALTTQAVPGAEAQSLAAGCADALCTPLDEELVYTTLRKWLGGG